MAVGQATASKTLAKPQRPRGPQQVGGVARGVDRAGQRQEDPLRAAPAREDGGDAHDECEEEHVADGIREVGCHRGGVGTRWTATMVLNRKQAQTPAAPRPATAPSSHIAEVTSRAWRRTISTRPTYTSG